MTTDLSFWGWVSGWQQGWRLHEAAKQLLAFVSRNVHNERVTETIDSASKDS